MFKVLTRGGLALIALVVVDSPSPPSAAPPLAPAQSPRKNTVSFANDAPNAHVEGVPLNPCPILGSAPH